MSSDSCSSLLPSVICCHHRIFCVIAMDHFQVVPDHSPVFRFASSGSSKQSHHINQIHNKAVCLSTDISYRIASCAWPGSSEAGKEMERRGQQGPRRGEERELPEHIAIGSRILCIVPLRSVMYLTVIAEHSTTRRRSKERYLVPAGLGRLISGLLTRKEEGRMEIPLVDTGAM